VTATPPAPAGPRPEASPAVRAAGIEKRFGLRPALRGIDIEVPSSGCFVLFGPNGAGKSTLLRIISTRMRPAAGRLEVLGLDAAREGEKVRARLGVVFHDTFLRGDLTLDENLRFHADLHGLAPRAARERADALVLRLGLAPRLHDRVRGFSQGMARRATIVRSLLHDPRVWLLDEPFAGLDPRGCEVLEEVIGEERAAGRAVVIVTHDIEIGLRLADDGAAIEDGRVVARGRKGLEEYAAGKAAGGPGATAGGSRS
jgi:ABC-type multidrug transport system ATPase subunit